MSNRRNRRSRTCSGESCLTPGSAASPFMSVTTDQYSLYTGNSFMPMKMKKPTTTSTIRKLINVRPDCFLTDFMESPATGLIDRHRRPAAATLVYDGSQSGKIHSAVLAIPVHPDQEGLAHQMVFRHEVPVAAVLAVVAIVAHHEVVAFRHRPDAFADAPALHP